MLGRVAFVALYILALLVLPALHHDIDCHFKSPSHCPACLASPMAAPVTEPAPLPSDPLPDAGGVVHLEFGSVVSSEPIPAFGRAPPL